MKATEVLQKFDNNISAMARGLEVSRQTVYNWVKNNDTLPKLRQYQVEHYFQNK
jgi:DNA-binding XRE family transcriptional regulator